MGRILFDPIFTKAMIHAQTVCEYDGGSTVGEAIRGIAKTLLNRRANCSPAQSGIYLNMRTVVRLQESIGQLEKEIAINLAQTQGAFLTSVRGIGIVLAAGVSAEIVFLLGVQIGPERKVRHPDDGNVWHQSNLNFPMDLFINRSY